jgi:predicted DNA binding protein
MTNIVDRLRDRAYSTKEGDELCEQAARLIEALEWRDKTRQNVIDRQAAEIDNMRLTDEERAAILTAADLLIGSKPGAILRNLLERLK